MKKALAIATIFTCLVACSDKNEVAAASPAPAATAAAPAPSLPAGPGKLTGVVVETMNAASYTYIKLRTPAGEEWAAVQQADVKQGSTVTVLTQMTAENFESNTLKRKFDRIAFGTLEQPGAATPAPAAGTMPPAPNVAAHMSANAGKVGDVHVPKADGPDARTVAEVWAAKENLKDRPVVVRGKVVKFLAGIMGRNWMHIQDGSGDAAQGTNDLTVTTDAVASAGDVVVVSGKLRVDKDFGAGYRYAALIEEAKVTK